MRLFALLFLTAMLVQAQQYRAFWADAFHYGFKSPSEVDQMLDDAERARVNAIFMQVRRRADSYYLRTLEVPAQDSTYSASFDALAYLIDRAHARGIEVHAWFVVYPLWPTAIAPPANPNHLWHKHGPRAAGEDMWMSISSRGATGGSLDPGHPGVQRYLAETILDPIDHYALDGIHLDYIRYSEDADYGWNPVAAERFNRMHARAGIPAGNDPLWAGFRRAQVTSLVRQIYLRAIEKRPSLRVSAALISWGNGPLNDAGWLSTDAYRTVFQDWRAWVEEGILDLAMPMHYFRETANAAFLDRWLNFARVRQFNRAYLPGLAPYLNSIPDSLAQVRRASIEPAAGVTLYSYASTNTLNAAGVPVTPNAEFYSQLGELFGQPARPPVLAWKETPAVGHINGVLEVDGGPGFLFENISVSVASDTGKDFERGTVTDATGFFGFVDVPVDRYRLRLSRSGRILFDATPQQVRAGAVTRFVVRLRPDDFAAIQPRITRASSATAAPGDVVFLEGQNFALENSYAVAVPLPTSLGGTQVLFAGVPLPLFSAAPGRVELQLPLVLPERWTLTVRRDGLDSTPFVLGVVAHRPVIHGIHAREGILEIYATGLGLTTPAVMAGSGADPSNLPALSAAVKVLVSNPGFELEMEPVYAGLTPYQPGRYQVNLVLPAAITAGEVRLKIGDAVSVAARF